MRERGLQRFDDMGFDDEIERRLMPTSLPVQDLDHQADLREKAFLESGRVAKYVNTVPPSAFRGTMGGQQEVFSGGPALDVAWWQGESDADNRAVTITLDNVGPIINGFPTAINVCDGGRYSYRPYANIFFGTRCMGIKVVVDIGTGCQFTVGASSVRVQIGMDAPGGIAPGVGSMQLTAMLTHFATQRQTPITRSLYADAIGASATQNFKVPKFGKTVLPIVSSDPTGQTQLDFLDVGGANVGSFLFVNGTTYPSAVVPPDAYTVNVTNKGLNASNTRVMFGLSF